MEGEEGEEGVGRKRERERENSSTPKARVIHRDPFPNFTKK